MKRILVWLLIFAPCLAARSALAAQQGDEVEAAEPIPASPVAPTLPGTRHEQDLVGELAPLDEVLWVDEALMLRRPARQGAPRGSVLLLAAADGGPAGSDRIGQLRAALPLHGWHTWFQLLPGTEPPDEQVLFRRIDAAISAVRQDAGGSLLVLSEGVGGHWLAACSRAAACRLDVDGLLLLNYPQHSDAIDGVPELIEALGLPTLIVQEDPRTWQREYPLGEDTELHLMPPGSSIRSDDRLIRRVRGWLKRRFG